MRLSCAASGAVRWRGALKKEGCHIRGLMDQLGAEFAICATRGGWDKGGPPQGGGQLGGRRPSLLPSTLYDLRRVGWGLVGLGSGWAPSHEGGELGGRQVQLAIFNDFWLTKSWLGFGGVRVWLGALAGRRRAWWAAGPACRPGQSAAALRARLFPAAAHATAARPQTRRSPPTGPAASGPGFSVWRVTCLCCMRRKTPGTLNPFYWSS